MTRLAFAALALLLAALPARAQDIRMTEPYMRMVARDADSQRLQPAARIQGLGEGWHKVVVTPPDKSCTTEFQ